MPEGLDDGRGPLTSQIESTYYVLSHSMGNALESRLHTIRTVLMVTIEEYDVMAIWEVVY